jgi:hypothetical protein
MSTPETRTILQTNPVAQQLLQSDIPARLAYTRWTRELCAEWSRSGIEPVDACVRFNSSARSTLCWRQQNRGIGDLTRWTRSVPVGGNSSVGFDRDQAR